MSVTCVSTVLLHTVVVVISARVLTTISPADQPILSPRHYQHTDLDSGTQLVCDKCPAGTYVSSHCSPMAVRECSPCPEGTFTRGENGVHQCHRCRDPCPVGLIEKAPCTATQDRICTCPLNSFFLGEDVTGCKPHLLCPPGTRVKKRGTATEDVICKLCPRGTFSIGGTSALKCQTHTNCEAQGLVLLTPGTRETDNVCAHPHPATSSSLSLSVSTSAPVGPALEAVQEPLMSSSSRLTSLTELSSKDHYSQSAAFQRKENQGEDDHNAERLHFDWPDSSTPRNRDSQRTSLSPDQKDQTKSKQQQGHPNSDSVPESSKLTIEDLQGTEIFRSGPHISKVAGQGSTAVVPSFYRPTRRGSPRPSSHNRFDINEHLPWMIVLLLLLVLVVIVVCSVKRSSRVLKKGPMQDPSSIMGKAIQKKPSGSLMQIKEKWIYYSNGQGVDILKLVAAHVGTQWIDIYQSLANATEREVAAFSNGYSSDCERAYAALQHWTIRDSDANLAKLINALHRHRRIDVVEKIRLVMEDNPQFDINQMMTSVNVSQSLSPIHKLMESHSSSSSGSNCGSLGGASGAGVDQSPMDRSKGFFPDESEPLLRCDSTSSKDSALSRNGSFITKERKDTVLRQVRLDPCDLQPVFDDMLHILNPEELRVIEEIPAAEDKLDQLFEIAGVKSQEASQTLLDSVYSHLPDLL
ncbi:tumor necrosis factor receptor superfamily member 21 isoform X2 [Betta splendens]|uniref:Tumor necrosis factor receptor superfamily member 21 isoform X2 n=1 Tax=Betta splendens TaxID=158456 RepID=A0A6P7LSZ5_BETSP|nr:tumor necrosis factor receptor superfamily member 21 isoform X2 [Betta splendens]